MEQGQKYQNFSLKKISLNDEVFYHQYEGTDHIILINEKI